MDCLVNVLDCLKIERLRQNQVTNCPCPVVQKRFFLVEFLLPPSHVFPDIALGPS